MGLTDIQAVKEQWRVLNFDSYSEWKRSKELPFHTKARSKIREPAQNKVTLQYSQYDEAQKKSGINRRLQGNKSECNFPTLASSSPAPLRAACSALCSHGFAQSTRSSPVERKKPRDDFISLFKAQIKARKKSLKDCKLHYITLSDENQRLRDEIMKFESSTHEETKRLLGRYKRYRSGAVVLESNHEVRLHRVGDDLKKGELQAKHDIAELRFKVEELDKHLAEKRQALKTLMNYKEKEYPERVERIIRLKESIHKTTKEFQEQLEVLDRLASNGKETYESAVWEVQNQIKSEVAQEVLGCIGDTDSQLAGHNAIMKKEIEVHKKEVILLQLEITMLQTQVRSLQAQSRNEKAMRKNPLASDVKCDPEAELELQIPQQNWLPI